MLSANLIPRVFSFFKMAANFVTRVSSTAQQFYKICVTLKRLSHPKICFRRPNSCFDVLCKRKMQTSMFISSSLNVDCGRRHFGTGNAKLMHRKGQCVSPNNLVVEDNQVLYRFKWMKQLRFISRVKIFHVAVVTSLIWPMSYWYSSGIISLPSLLCAITGAAGTTAGLVALSYFFRRVVGELCFAEATEQVTISSLTFWGNRRSRTFPLMSLVPLSDSGIDMNDTFHRLEVNDCTDVYLLNLQHCKIFDEKFFSVTGLPMDEMEIAGLLPKK